MKWLHDYKKIVHNKSLMENQHIFGKIHHLAYGVINTWGFTYK